MWPCANIVRDRPPFLILSDEAGQLKGHQGAPGLTEGTVPKAPTAGDRVFRTGGGVPE